MVSGHGTHNTGTFVIRICLSNGKLSEDIQTLWYSLNLCVLSYLMLHVNLANRLQNTSHVEYMEPIHVLRILVILVPDPDIKCKPWQMPFD